MQTTFDFDAMIAEKAGTRPTFRVGGQDFTAKARLPFRAFSKMVDMLSSPDMDDTERTEQFFRLVLVRDDQQRFIDLLNRDDDGDDEWSVISPEQVQKLTNWLLELYTGKRVESSDSSSDGANSTGQSQNVVSLTPRNAQAG